MVVSITDSQHGSAKSKRHLDYLPEFWGGGWGLLVAGFFLWKGWEWVLNVVVVEVRRVSAMVVGECKLEGESVKKKE